MSNNCAAVIFVHYGLLLPFLVCYSLAMRHSRHVSVIPTLIFFSAPTSNIILLFSDERKWRQVEVENGKVYISACNVI